MVVCLELDSIGVWWPVWNLTEYWCMVACLESDRAFGCMVACLESDCVLMNGGLFGI